jgi:hypothetical protein
MSTGRTGTKASVLAVVALAALCAASGPALAWDGCGCGWGRHAHHRAHYRAPQYDNDIDWRDREVRWVPLAGYPPYPNVRTTTTCTPFGCYQERCDDYSGCVRGPWYWRH